jgi:hypothetical protein
MCFPLQIPWVPEVQTVTVSAGAEDLDGNFFLIYRGEITHAIPWYATADYVKSELEGLSKIGRVDVTAVNTSLSSPLPFIRFGRQWSVTFISEHGNVPSLLVSTNDGATATVRASHGLPDPVTSGLRGTTPRVEVSAPCVTVSLGHGAHPRPVGRSPCGCVWLAFL